MKTEVTIQNDDHEHKEYKKGDFGYVDGYVRGGNNAPLAVVVLETTNDRNGIFVLVPLHNLKKREYRKN